jgi:predicted nucleic acid-binding protein
VLDSSALVSAFHTGDAHHAKARAIVDDIARGAWEQVLLHEYVFLETVTVLAVRQSFQLAVGVGESLLASREVEFVASSEAFDAVWQTFRGQRRGKLSFADSALIALAKTRGATHIATFDKDLLKASGLVDATAKP